MASSSSGSLTTGTSVASCSSQSPGGSPESDEEDIIVTDQEDSRSSPASTPPQKKHKKYMCVYRKQYSKSFPWSTDSKKGLTYAFCMRCNRDISMGQGGTKDLKRHEQTSIHLWSEKGCVGVMPLQSYFGPVRDESVICAEVKFGYFLGEHHLAFQLADHCTKLFRSMFPDSSIAKDFKCGCTKATAVLKVIAQDTLRHIIEEVRVSKYFSLQTDETTDINVTQQAAIMLRFFDNTVVSVRCVFFALEYIERATAEKVFESIDKHFKASDPLTYDNLIGLGTDGANVMLGARNSVMSRLKSKQPALVAMHCHCHIAALVANSACKVLPNDLEDLTTDVWYYFQKTPKRMREFEQFQCFVETKPHKLLKACQTRWLSLEACVNRLIEQYDALLSYFRSTDDKLAVVKRVKIVLEKPTTKAYLLFLSAALPIINNFNKLMQQQAPVLHILHQELEGLVKKLLLHFMKPEYICAISDLSEVNLDDSEHYLPLEQVYIGQNTQLYLEENDDITSTSLLEFRRTIQTWWVAAYKGSVKRLPLNHKLLINLKWLQPGLQQYSNSHQVVAAADCLTQVISMEAKSLVQEEFMDYCTSPLPPSIKNITEVDRYWHEVSQIKDLNGVEYRYPTLTKLAKAMLVIPHGNADTERLFSHLGLNKTKHRNSLGLSTLNSLLTVQFNLPQKCFEFKPSKDLIKRCKNAVSEARQPIDS